MHPLQENEHIPWDLIVGELQGTLTGEERGALESWLAEQPANREKFGQLERLWQKGVRKYELYLQTDAEAGWVSLHHRMHAHEAGGRGRKLFTIISGRRMARAMAAALVIAVLVIAADRWISSLSTGLVFDNSAQGARTLSLPDGTSVVLQPGAKIRTGKDFNKADRTVVMERGAATFGVSDKSSLAFEVHVADMRVRDIGTRFSVQQAGDSVVVSVLSGKVACIRPATGMSRQVSEGMAVSYILSDRHFGEPILTGLIRDSSRNLLQFDNVPLSDVLGVLEKITGRVTRLEDPAFGRLMLTARLDGETYEDAMRIICVSLELEYTSSGVDGEGILKKRAAK